MSYSREYLIGLLEVAYEKLGRLPTRREMREHFNVTEKPFIREFHSWEEAKNFFIAQRSAQKDSLELDFTLNEDTLYGDIVKIEQAHGEITDFVSETFGKKPTRILSLSDIELPYANLKMINHAVKHALSQGAEIVVLNGDVTHSDFFSKHTKTVYIPPAEEYKQLEQLIAYLSAKFKMVVLVRGNHDDMVERYCARNMNMEHFKFLVRYDLLANVAERYSNVFYAQHWWVKLFDMIYAHPSFYSVVPMRTALNTVDVVARFTDFRGLMIGHTHKVGHVIDTKGRLVIEQGCACNMQNYQVKRPVRTVWISAYNIAAFDEGKLDFNDCITHVMGRM